MQHLSKYTSSPSCYHYKVLQENFRLLAVCVNRWHSGDEALTKTCPACRADRSYNETMLLRGLDEFLIGVRQAIQTEDERDEEEIPAVTVD